MHRVVLVATAFSMFSMVFAASGPTVRWPLLGLFLALGICVLVAVVVIGFAAGTERWFGRAELVLLLVALGVLAMCMIANILGYPPYRSDEEIFVQYSANLLRHGHNPYAADMLPAYAQYPAPMPTKLLDGGITHSLDYPALPTLLATLLTVLIGDFHTVAVLCTLSLIAAAAVMYRLLPRGLRSLAALTIVGVPALASAASGGLLCTLAIAPLAFVAHRWRHTGRGGRLSRPDRVRAVVLGVAASTTQVAWFPIPFLVLGILLCRRRELARRDALGVTARFVGIAVLTFLAINAVFIVWGPAAWLRGAFAPIVQHAVPEGQGLINLTQSLAIGSGDLSLYTYAGALVMAGLLVAYWRYFDRLGPACFALPLVGLLFPARSYWTYFIAYGAAWMVALLSHGDEAGAPPQTPAVPRQRPVPPAAGRKRPTRSAVIVAASFVPAGLVFGMALASTQPLALTIEGDVTSAQLGSVQAVTLSARNDSGNALSPHFMAVHGTGVVSGVWNIASGPATLPPHATARYVITAPSYGSMPPITGGLKIEAVTDSPPTASYSTATRVHPYLTVLTSEQPDMPLLQPRQPVVLTSRVQTEFGRPVREAGIRLCLAQVNFANSGSVDHRAEISAAPGGDRFGCGVTDGEGRVEFTVTSEGTGSRQLYFQSYAVEGSYGAFGYSPWVTATWR